VSRDDDPHDLVATLDDLAQTRVQQLPLGRILARAVVATCNCRTCDVEVERAIP